MGYVLELYAIDLTSFEAALLAASPPLDLEAEQRQSQAEGIPWSDWVVLRGHLADLARLHAGNQGETTGLDDEVRDLLFGMVRARAALVGTLDHASASAAEFHSSFLSPSVLEARFGDSALGSRLIGRPLLGFEGRLVPAWGWMSLAELERLKLGPTGPPGRRHKSEHVAQWLDDLETILVAVRSRGRDLVALYM